MPRRIKRPSSVVSRNKDWKITRKSLAPSHLRGKKQGEGIIVIETFIVDGGNARYPENTERSIESTILGRAEDANGGRSKRFFSFRLQFQPDVRYYFSDPL